MKARRIFALSVLTIGLSLAMGCSSGGGDSGATGPDTGDVDGSGPSAEVPGAAAPVVGAPGAAVEMPVTTPPVTETPEGETPIVPTPDRDLTDTLDPGDEMPVIMVPSTDVPDTGGETPIVDVPATPPPVTDVPGSETPIVFVPDGDLPDVPDPGGKTPASVADTTTTTGNSILDYIRGTDGEDDDLAIDTTGEHAGPAELSAMAEALKAYPELMNLLDDESQVLTVFVPTNEAFARFRGEPTFDDGALDDAASAGVVTEATLAYHVISGNDFNVEGLRLGSSRQYQTVSEGYVEISVALVPASGLLGSGRGPVSIDSGIGLAVDERLAVTVNDEPALSTVRFPANGTVHVINAVLDPADVTVRF